MPEQLGIILPPGVERPAAGQALPDGRGLIVNETDLPDRVVEEAVSVFFEEQSSMLGANSPRAFSTYAGQAGGSLLTRSKLRTPTNVIEEIILARDLAEKDDDIRPAIGAAVALAFGEPMLNAHTDEIVAAQWDQIARKAKLRTRVFPEMYRELLIAGQVTTARVFMREAISFTPPSGDRQRTRSLAYPLVGIMPAEQIRVLGNDLFGTADLLYRPFSGQQERWLQEFFNPQTTAARRAEMQRQDPLLTTLLIEQIPWDAYANNDTQGVYGDPNDPGQGMYVYRLNPALVCRVAFPKGQWPYPRPPLTSNFPLLEAKRLLNIMDYGLLEGGANFLVVVKKGTDQWRALPQEIDNLRTEVRKASRQGVLVGDHRLSVDIITPDLKELLNSNKRNLIARKLTASLLRVPSFAASGDDPGTGGVDAEILSRVIASDRGILVDHAECEFYEPTADRNDNLDGVASIWFPKIVLQGLQFWTDMVLKLRDRGDIPRKWGVQMAGFNYEAGVAQRKFEKANGDDRALTPPPVPFSGGPGGPGPQDNGAGRPRGSGPANGAPGSAPPRPGADKATPRQLLTQNAGETVRSWYDESNDTVHRVGELTHALLEEYSDTAQPGRVTPFERDALDRVARGENRIFHHGPLTIIPVNMVEDIGDVHAVTLAQGFRALVGRTDDNAVLTQAFSFRAPEFSRLDAEEMLIRLGWEPPALELSKGGVEPGKYVYLRCPNCGCVQDAANARCVWCHHDLEDARRAMFAQLNEKGDKPTLHDAPPPPPSKQNLPADKKA